MSSEFTKQAGDILRSAPAPDAEASVIKEVKQKEDKPKKRGRPKGSSSSKRGRPKKAELEQYDAGARALNTALFATVCAVTGTGDAWPKEDKEKVMDKALSRYLQDKGFLPPSELLLVGVYADYLSAVSREPTVIENLKSRFSALKRFRVFNKIGDFFARRKAKAQEKKKGLIRK